MGHRGAAGFTLVELVMVLLIVGLLAWVAAPSRSAIDEIKLRAAARRVAADLRYAQGLAVTRRIRHGVSFDTASSSYFVYSPTPRLPVPDPANPGRPLIEAFRAGGELQGVSIDTASFGGSSAVAFDTFGTPLDASGRDLLSPGHVVLSYAGARASVAIEPGTGRVTLR